MSKIKPVLLSPDSRVKTQPNQSVSQLYSCHPNPNPSPTRCSPTAKLKDLYSYEINTGMAKWKLNFTLSSVTIMWKVTLCSVWTQWNDGMNNLHQTHWYMSQVQVSCDAAWIIFEWYQMMSILVISVNETFLSFVRSVLDFQWSSEWRQKLMRFIWYKCPQVNELPE